MSDSKESKIRTRVTLDPETYAEVRHIAADRGLDVGPGDVIREAVVELLARRRAEAVT